MEWPCLMLSLYPDFITLFVIAWCNIIHWNHILYTCLKCIQNVWVGTWLNYIIPFYLYYFFKWAIRKDYILYNPMKAFDLPRFIPTIPKNVLTAAEAEQVINTPDITKPCGLVIFNSDDCYLRGLTKQCGKQKIIRFTGYAGCPAHTILINCIMR